MDLATLVASATYSGSRQALEAALLACTSEGGSIGLEYVVSLVLSDYEEFPWKAELKSLAAFTLMYWKEDGVTSLYFLALPKDSGVTQVTALAILAYAASYNLHFASQLHLNGHPSLQARLDFLSEDFHSSSFVNLASDHLFDLVWQIKPDEIAPSNVLQVLLRLSQEASYTSSIASFNILFRAFSTRWLRLYERASG